MKRYYGASIVQFDENNVPYTKELVCIKSSTIPTEEEIKLEFDDIFNEYNGDEIRDIHEIPEDEALELYEDVIVEW